MRWKLCRLSTINGSSGKESAYNAEIAGSNPGSGRSPGGGNGNPLQYSCLENLMAREAWWATVHKVSKNRTRLSAHVSPSLIPETLNFLPLQGCMYVLFPWIWVTVYLPLWFSSVQSLSRVWLFATPWNAALQASLSITNSWSLPKLRSIELVMPSYHHNQPLWLTEHKRNGIMPV